MIILSHKESKQPDYSHTAFNSSSELEPGYELIQSDSNSKNISENIQCFTWSLQCRKGDSVNVAVPIKLVQF